MTKVKKITAIFKRNFIFLELKKLLKKEGFEINLKKNIKSLSNSNLQNSILIVEIVSENELNDILSLFKKKIISSYFIFILNKNMKFSTNNFNFKTFIQPIMFNELIRYIKTLETTFDKQKSVTVLLFLRPLHSGRCAACAARRLQRAQTWGWEYFWEIWGWEDFVLNLGLGMFMLL